MGTPKQYLYSAFFNESGKMSGSTLSYSFEKGELSTSQKQLPKKIGIRDLLKIGGQYHS